MSRPVHVLAVGAFGQAVADLLVADGLAAPAPAWPPEAWPTGAGVLAAWRPVPALAGELDEGADRGGAPWLPVVQEHPLVRVGPAVVPGLGPCHGCAVLRSRQHDEAADVTAAMDRFYDAHQEAGPAGYLPPIATAAAMAAGRALARLAAAPAAEAGRVWELDALRLEARAGRVVGVHGCPRCGSPAGSGRDGALAAELRHVLGRP